MATGLVPLTPEVELRLMLDGVVDGYESYEDALAAATRPTTIADPVAGLDMLYSSGTTGRPKGIKAALPRNPVDTPDPGVRRSARSSSASPTRRVYLSPAPLYHSAPLRFTMAVHQVGGTVVVMEHFDAGRGAGADRAVPRDVQPVGADDVHPDAEAARRRTRNRYDLSSLQVAVHAAAPCPVEVKRQMIEWWGPILHEYYAGTEGNGFVYTNSEDWLAHPGTVGRNLTGEIHIVDDDGEELPAGEAGTHLVRRQRGVRVPQRPGQDRRVARCPGLEHARRRRLPRRRGLPLPHRPQVVHDHHRRREHLPAGDREPAGACTPKVADVAVIGVPNEDFGEEVKAVVQPAEGSDAGPGARA